MVDRHEVSSSEKTETNIVHKEIWYYVHAMSYCHATAKGSKHCMRVCDERKNFVSRVLNTTRHLALETGRVRLARIQMGDV